ncbi:MAG: FHA domain-containing protein [Oscillatoria sp. SIO1A7]|nr:FHA domain-containing protein [Oscillatoria sp. SIO1A7]
MLKIRTIAPPPEDPQQQAPPPQMSVIREHECLIGRHESCGIQLNSPHVSRIHGRIFFWNGQYCYSDLKSADGSRVNNQPIEGNEISQIHQGDVIRIGGFVLTVEEVTTEDAKAPQEPQQSQVVVEADSNVWRKGKITVRCMRVIDETRDVKTFVFATDPPVRFEYLPGQFVTLNLEINGKRIPRSYSISSTPSRPHTLEITVKRVPPPSHAPDAPPGLVSNWLHDNIRVGSEILLSGPKGKFTCLPNPAKKLLLISAGSGITPVLSMSRYLCDINADVDIVFLHSARSSRDIILRRELEMMAGRYSNFRLAVTLTRPEPEEAWLAYVGRLNETMLSAIASDYKERTVYICGPNPFMEGVKLMLERLGFPMENYNEESFGEGAPAPSTPPATANASSSTANVPAPIQAAPAPPPAPSPSPAPSPPSAGDSAPALFYKDESGQEVAIPWDGEQTILQAAEDADFEIDSVCLSGACGTCKRIIEGEIKYDKEPGPKAFKDFSQEQGYQLTCITKPAGRVVIGAAPPQ